MRTLVLLALLPLTACEGDFTYNVDTDTSDGDSVESSIQAYLETDGIEVTSISCDQTASTTSNEVGTVLATYVCDVEQPGGEGFVVDAETVLGVEPDGTPMVEWSGTTRDMLVVSALEDKLEAQFSEAAGLPIAVECGAPRVRPSTPGDAFACPVTGGQNEQQVFITITNEDGDVDFRVGS